MAQSLKVTPLLLGLILATHSVYASQMSQNSPFSGSERPTSRTRIISSFEAKGDSFLKMNFPVEFQVDNRLQKNVEFWILIYSKYSSTEGLIHDSKYVDKVYQEVSLSGPTGKKVIKVAKEKWKQVLLSVHHKRNHLVNLSDDENAVVELYKDVDEPNKFLNAAHRRRLRFQLGQKDHFIRGLQQSGKYLKAMEEIFKRESLPVELTRLPFVESSFNLRARSKVGASGIWQFMKSTARLYLRINQSVDERNDPIRATEAAAKLLRLNYMSLGNWGLAVTAYNHGRKGMMRAVRKIGTDDIEELTEEYHSRSFGFASSNFFTELLAAIEVEKHADRYFGPITRDEPLQFTEIKVDHSILLSDLEKLKDVKRPDIRELNPGLSERVFAGKRKVPKGYYLRIPSRNKPSSLKCDTEQESARQ